MYLGRWQVYLWCQCPVTQSKALHRKGEPVHMGAMFTSPCDGGADKYMTILHNNLTWEWKPIAPFPTEDITDVSSLFVYKEGNNRETDIGTLKEQEGKVKNKQKIQRRGHMLTKRWNKWGWEDLWVCEESCEGEPKEKSPAVWEQGQRREKCQSGLNQQGETLQEEEVIRGSHMMFRKPWW